MSERPALVGLQCVRCNTPVPAEPDEVAWVCQNCGQGLLLDEDVGLQAIEIHAAAGTAEAKSAKAFWVASGRVRFTRRESYGADSPPDARWQQPARFVLPAFSTTVEQAVALGVGFVMRPVKLEPGPAQPVRGVTVLPAQIASLARFVVLTIEANRSDKLEAIDFTLELEPAELWCLPFEGP
jgi:hypothetical protein